MRFGEVVLCRNCEGVGSLRGSGLDKPELRRRAAIRKRDPDDPAGEVPSRRRCETCDGAGTVPRELADRPTAAAVGAGG